MKAWISKFNCCFSASGKTDAGTTSLRASSPLRRLGQHPGAVPARPALLSTSNLIARYDQSSQGVLVLACQPCCETVCIPYSNVSARTLLGLLPGVSKSESELQRTGELLALFGQKEPALLRDLCAHLVRIADGNPAGNVTMYIAAQSLLIEPPIYSAGASGRTLTSSDRMPDLGGREREDMAGSGKIGIQPTRPWHHALVEPVYFNPDPTPDSNIAAAADSSGRADIGSQESWFPSGAGDPGLAWPAVLVTFHPTAPGLPHSPKEPVPSASAALPTTVATAVDSSAPQKEDHIDMAVASPEIMSELLRHNSLQQGAQKQQLQQPPPQPQQQPQQPQEQPRALTLKSCSLPASASSSPVASGTCSTRLGFAAKLQQQGLLEPPGAPGLQPDRSASAEAATMNAVWLRERMVLSGLTPIVTAVSLDGQEVLYQNAASVAYYGPCPQQLAYQAAIVTPASTGVPGSFDDSADDSLWRALFCLDAGKLSRMKADICDEGRVWRGIVQVPVSCSTAGLPFVSGGTAEMGGALKGSTGPQLRTPSYGDGGPELRAPSYTSGRALASGMTDAHACSGALHSHPPSGPTSATRRLGSYAAPPTGPSTASLAETVRRLRRELDTSKALSGVALSGVALSGVSVGADAGTSTAPLSPIRPCQGATPTTAAAVAVSTTVRRAKGSEADCLMSIMNMYGSTAPAVMQTHDVEACSSAQRLSCASNVVDPLATSTWGLLIEATEPQGGPVGAWGRASQHLHKSLRAPSGSSKVLAAVPASVAVANANGSTGTTASAATASAILPAQGSTAGNSARGLAPGMASEGEAVHRCFSFQAAPVIPCGVITAAAASANNSGSGGSSRQTLRVHSAHFHWRSALGVTGSAERIENPHVQPGELGSTHGSSLDTEGLGSAVDGRLDRGTPSQQVEIPQRCIRPPPRRCVSRGDLARTHSPPSSSLPGVLAFASSLRSTPTVVQAALQQAIAGSGAACGGGGGGAGASGSGVAGSSCRLGRPLSAAASVRAPSLGDTSGFLPAAAQAALASLERDGYNACSFGPQDAKPAEASPSGVPSCGAPSPPATSTLRHAPPPPSHLVFPGGSSSGRQAAPGRSGTHSSGRLSRRLLETAAAGFGGRSHRGGGLMRSATRALGSVGAALDASSSCSAGSHGTSQARPASVGAAADAFRTAANAAETDAAVSEGGGSAAAVARPYAIISFGSDGGGGGGCSGAGAMALGVIKEAQPRPKLADAGLCVEVAGGGGAVDAVVAAGYSQPLQARGSLEATALMTGQYCWHEVAATRTVDPVTGQYAVLVTQVDVTAKVEAERHLAFVSEAEHRLLKQIFPRHVLAHLTEEGAPWSGHLSGSVANVRDVNKLATSHSNVTLLFADIEGFTPMCKMLEPRVVMAFLNDLFTTFDRKLDDFGVYKVETIGDCYFVAGGLIHEDEDGMAAVRDRGSKEDPLHAEKVFMFAKAMLAAASKVILPTTGTPVRMRIGIHSGPVVSGVVGERMPRFCLFGDTVNTTSRMESTGVAGCIHASEAAYKLLRNEMWVPTGGIEVKGKGLMNTYLWAPPDQDSQAILTRHISARSSKDAAAGRTAAAASSSTLRDGAYGNAAWSTGSSLSPATVDVQPTALPGSSSDGEGGVGVGGGADVCMGGDAGGKDAVRPFVVVHMPAACGGGGGGGGCARLGPSTSRSSPDTVDLSILGLVRELLPGKGL